MKNKYVKTFNSSKNINVERNKIKIWEKENKKEINIYNKMIKENGLILKNSRMF